LAPVLKEKEQKEMVLGKLAMILKLKEKIGNQPITETKK
jgi:hypothetical protein